MSYKTTLITDMKGFFAEYGTAVYFSETMSDCPVRDTWKKDASRWYCAIDMLREFIGPGPIPISTVRKVLYHWFPEEIKDGLPYYFNRSITSDPTYTRFNEDLETWLHEHD